jgi:hypothetical protein
MDIEHCWIAYFIHYATGEGMHFAFEFAMLAATSGDEPMGGSESTAFEHAEHLPRWRCHDLSPGEFGRLITIEKVEDLCLSPLRVARH